MEGGEGGGAGCAVELDGGGGGGGGRGSRGGEGAPTPAPAPAPITPILTISGGVRARSGRSSGGAGDPPAEVVTSRAATRGEDHCCPCGPRRRRVVIPIEVALQVRVVCSQGRRNAAAMAGGRREGEPPRRGPRREWHHGGATPAAAAFGVGGGGDSKGPVGQGSPVAGKRAGGKRAGVLAWRQKPASGNSQSRSVRAGARILARRGAEGVGGGVAPGEGGPPKKAGYKGGRAQCAECTSPWAGSRWQKVQRDR